MAQLVISADEVTLRDLVGTAVYLQARDLVDAGRVSGVRWHDSGRAFGHVNDLSGVATAIVMVKGAGEGDLTWADGDCTCRDPQPCVHSAAILLTALRKAATAPARPPDPSRGHLTAVPAPGATSPSWQRALTPLLPPTRPATAAPERAEIALQFELVLNGPQGRGRVGPRIGLRPVVPGQSGRWIRGGISWTNFSYAHRSRSRLAVRHIALLREVLALYSVAGGYSSYSGGPPFLDAAPSRRIWDLLAEAHELGLPLVQSGKKATDVVLADRPAEAVMTVERTDDGLVLAPHLSVDDSLVDLDHGMLLGDPAHGVARWDHAGGLWLAPLRLTDTPVQALLQRGPIEVPAADEAVFMRDYYPRLRQQVRLTSKDASIELPEADPPVLRLEVHRLEQHQVRLSWSFTYAVGPARRTEPLWPGGDGRRGGSGERDGTAEAAIVGRVVAAIGELPVFENTAYGRRIAPSVVIGGIATVQFLTGVLPALGAMDDVEVVLTADQPGPVQVPDYRPAEAEPVITIDGDRAGDDRDWFNLSVQVSVDGQQVPFDELFVALAQQQEHLILASGTYFSLDRDEFHRLAELIAEARALQDVETGGGVRLSRFQAGLWEELEQIGVVSGQAAQWQASVQALSAAADVAEHPVPAGLNATLRPYQLAGFNWLAALYHYRLGGILADDMGLGKTLQALALFCHVREHGLSDAPFLVVAPTSVVFNWASEAARFAPGLKVAAISETAARRGDDLATSIAGADVVVTSYTLFRLEYDEYAAVEWAGMVLDEAQFVKNHQSRGYQCAKRLPAPFKLAVTGTPMENNLMELWSMLSITAPGLFASPAKFTEYYRNPIEKDRDATLLDRLRRRVRPLMLRRTKEQVATDLPDKQEQVIELELNPKHRKVYQTHLQRERQKVLGLLTDVQKHRFEIFRSLTLLRQAALDASLIDPAYSSVPSTKLDAMVELVHDIAEEGHRTLIFSQFTRFLTSARERLAEAGIDYCYLDGSTRNRASVLKEFKTGTAPVFLISLKAGGVGLNLTEADYCILLDPWWNPATEAQAVDRVHRIGQTRKVMVYRLVAKDTIEEKVMALKAGKAALFESVMSGGDSGRSGLSAQEIRSLLE